MVEFCQQKLEVTFPSVKAKTNRFKREKVEQEKIVHG